MPVINVSFSKLLVERREEPTGQIKINNNVSVKEIKKTELRLGTAKQDALLFNFAYTADYEPNHANIVIEGSLVYMAPNERIDAILKEWKKDKKVDKALMTEVVNNLLNRCNIEALILSKEMGLPSPIPLPKVE